MEYIAGSSESRAIDRFTIEHTGIPSLVLMERASLAVSEHVMQAAGKDHDVPICCVCGSGNNGGDGYALAEILADRGISATLFRVSEKFSDDGLYYYKNCLKKGVGDLLCDEFTDFGGYDIIVDCILGTGFSGTLRDDMTGLIEQINRSSARVVSVDINSGLSGSNGLALPVAVRSDLTVSIGCFKTGMFLNDAPRYIGELKNVDIGIKLLKKQYYLITADELSPFVGYQSESLSADRFSLEYAVDEEEFRRSPIKVVAAESAESGKVFVVDYGGSKLIVDQSYVYFQSDRIKLF